MSNLCSFYPLHFIAHPSSLLKYLCPWPSTRKQTSCATSMYSAKSRQSVTSIHKVLKRRYFIFSLSFERSRLGHEPKTNHVIKFHVNVQLHESEVKDKSEVKLHTLLYLKSLVHKKSRFQHQTNKRLQIFLS